MNYWLRSGFLTLLEKGSGLVFALGTAVLLLRGLSKEDFAAWGIFLLITYFLEMGRTGLIQNGLLRYLALERDDANGYAAVTTAALVLNLAFSIVSNLLLWLGMNWLIGTYHAPQIAVVLPVYFLTNFIMAFFYHCNFVQQANFEFRGIFWSTFFWRGTLFAWVLYCKISGTPIVLQQLAFAMLTGAMLGAVASFLFARPFLKHSKYIDFQWVKRLVAYGKYVLGTNLSTMFYKSIDKLTLGHLIGPAAFAVYDAAGKVTQLVETPSFSIAAVVFPQSAGRMEREGPEGIKRLYERSVAAILAIILPFLVGVLLFAEPVIWLFAGQKYMESANILRVTAFFGLFLPFAVQFGTILDSTGRPATNFRYTLFTAVLNFGLSYLFVWQFGLFGAAYATLLGYSVSFVLMQRLLFHDFGIRWWKAFGFVPEIYRIGFQMIRKRLFAERKEASDTCVVFFSLFRTDNSYSSISLSMAKELAKNHRVFYVNHPYTLRDVWGGLRSGDPVLRKRLPKLLTRRTRYEGVDSIPENFIAAQPPVTWPINWLPKGFIYNAFQRWNNAIVLRTIRKVLRDHGVKNYIFINCYDPFYAGCLPSKMGASLSIYHCIDDITQNAYTHKHGTGLENEAIRQADITFVTSTNLKKLKSPYSDRIVTYFNAADVGVFHKVITEKYPRPTELADKTGKVIGFIGNLDEQRIDYPLLKKIAEIYTDCTLLLVGPVNSPEPVEIGLDHLPNVVFAGSRRLEELPPLLQHMDCVLIPFRCNTLTRSIYPLKINEYLAAGKPVVSTAFSEDIRSFSDCIYLAEDEDSYIQQIVEALHENDPAMVQRRLQVAGGNTWSARIEQLWAIVDQYEVKSKNLVLS